MQVVPFNQVNRIKSQLSIDLLRRLVGIFSCRKGDDLLLVYLPDATPEQLPDHCRAITLNDFLRFNIAKYDGPVIAFSGIDVIRTEVPTKGPFFYSLGVLLGERRLFDLLYDTSAGLSSYLLHLLRGEMSKALDELPAQRATVQIIWLATRALLTGLPRQNLVALIPDQDLDAFVHVGKCRAVYTTLPESSSIPPDVEAHPIHSFDELGFLDSEDRVVAFEEVCLDRTEFSPETTTRFLELRRVLRLSGLEDAISQTLQSLAREFYSRWTANRNSEENLQIAYSLALESQLMELELDIEDLIAVLPCNDFHHFVNNGSAIYVYRQLPEGEIATRNKEVRLWSLSELNSGALLGEHGRLVFSLLPLRSKLEILGVGVWYDLGPLFYRAGKTGFLARSGWLLARDLAGWSRGEREVWGVLLTDLVKTIAHCCELFSLEDPWLRQGRLSQALPHAYGTLTALLEMQEQITDAPARLYYHALRLWYTCGGLGAQEIEQTVRRMVEMLQEYEQKSRHINATSRQLRDEAEHLQHLGKALLHMQSGGGQSEVIQRVYAKELSPGPGSVPQAIRQAAAMKAQPAVPSWLFGRAFQEYAKIVEGIQHIRTSRVPVEDKIPLLQQGLSDLENSSRVVFALYHEQRVLTFLYERAIKQTEFLIRQLQGSARLEVELVTRSVAQHVNNVLTFDVKNIGRVEAKEITVELFRSEHFQLIDESSVKEIRTLPPEAEDRIAFTIRPELDNDFAAEWQVKYYDLRPQPEMQKQVSLLRVISLDQGPFRAKPNPYIYGVPLQDYRLFYGRQQELNSLLSHLAGGRPQNVLLRGARRAGKTSVLNMLKAIIEDHGRHRLIRQWFDVPEEWQTVLDRLQPVLLDLQKIEREDGSFTTNAFYQAVLDGIRRQGVGNANLDTMPSESNISTTRFERILEATLEENPGVRLVLLMDEFDVVDLISDRAFYAHLRHVISNVQGVTWIIASALGLYKEVRDYESPLFNVFKIIDLGRLEPESARDLILDPWRPPNKQTGEWRVKFQFTDDAIDAILYETGRYPYFIQLLCSAVIEHVNSVETNYVLYKTVRDVVEKLVAPRSAAYEHFAYFWDRASGMGKAILLVLLGSVEPPTTQDLSGAVHARLSERGVELAFAALAAQYENNLRRLQAVDAITLDNRNRLVFAIPLFRRLLVERSEREDLWSTTLQELQIEIIEEREDA